MFSARTTLVFILSILFLSSCNPSDSPQSSGRRTLPAEVDVIINLAAAFNAHSPERKGEFVHEEIIWYGMYADTFVVEANGRDHLLTSMAGYFKSLPSARSKMESITPSGGYVAVRERAYWTSKDGEKSQASLAVYEVKENKVSRVWYFPACE